MPLKYLLITTTEGRTTLARVGEGSTGYAIHEGDGVADIKELNVTHEEFTGLLQKIPTHDIKLDTMSGEVSVTPKTEPNVEAQQ